MRIASYKEFLGCDGAASLVEYSLLVGLVSVAILLAVVSISGSIATTWSTLASIVAVAAAP